MPRSITALGLPADLFEPDASVTLTGAEISGQAASVTASVPAQGDALGRLSPLGLHQAGYGAFSKQANVTVSLVGAEIRGQGEELEGASVVVRLRGATMFGQGGLFSQEQIQISPTGGFAGMNAHLAWQQREDKRKKDAKKRFEKEEWFLGPDGWTKVKY